ncbi:circadian clock protein PASD1 [Lontra canadensis]|uniref:circadian clock protein PASD1 n=1 Tax=Lontra canadensis TaxID=76717 RepID=UPI0013F392E9|nr:circadian clock protein PASD1 [Lontra canadensis]
MDEAEREKEKRDVPDVTENKKKDRFNAFFTELRAMLQAHGYPVKGDRSKISQGTTAASPEKEGKVNPETSREQSNWIPSFHSYEDFKCKTLQSLDGFMIILSTDGVIIFVAENITCLLGHLPNEVIGKKLLSLLPDHEKNEVYRKIALKLPLSNSVGKHIDFCCHLKRGNVEHDSGPTYEYAKLILTVQDILNEPLMLFSSFFPSHAYAESSPTYLPLEDRFYLVGSIFLFRAQILRELFSVKKAEEEVLLIEDSDEEPVSPEHRSQGQKRSSRMELLCAESAAAAAASEDQVGIGTVEQYGPQESDHVIRIESDTSYDSSTSSLESILASPVASSSQSFEFQPVVEQVSDVDEVQVVDELEEVDQMEQMDEVDEVGQVDEEEEVEQMEELEQEWQLDQVEEDKQLDRVEQEDQADQAEQEASSPSSVAAGISDESIQPPPSIMSYINKRELELMKKFREQLEEQTRMLQADIRSQRDALEMMKEQLQRIQDSTFQMQPTISHHLDHPEFQSLEPVPKKQRTEQMKESLPDLNEISLSCGSCSPCSFKFSEELEETCDDSNQPLLEGQDPFLQQPLQQTQDQLLSEQQVQEQPQPPSTVVGRQKLQIYLPGQAGVAVPLCEDPMTFMHTQTIVPVQLAAGQQPSGCYQGDTLGDEEDDSPSFFPEEQQKVSMVYSPGSDTVASTSFPQSPIHSDSSLVTLETPQDYIQLWQQPPDSQHHLYLQVNTWPSSEHNSLQDQATWPQVSAPQANPEAFQDPEEYSPGHISYFMSAERSSSDENQHQQYFHTET